MNAAKERFGKSDLKKIFADASKVIVGKGKKVVTFNMKDTSPGDADFVAAVLGPTGNLRAPAIRTGKTWLIGFHEEPFGERFG